MKETHKKKTGSEIEVEVVLEQKEFDTYWQEAHNEATSKIHLKGFRPGTAPKELSDQAVNKDKVFEEASLKAVKWSLDEIIEDNNWIVVSKPKIEIIEANPIGKEGPGLKYKAEFSIFPEVKLGDYKKIAKDILKEKNVPEVKEEEVDKTFSWLRESRAKLTRVSRDAVKGDLVEVDVESSLEGKPIEGGTLHGEKMVLGESKFIPGFDEKLENHKENEEIIFSLKAPADYWQKDLQNKEIEFKVIIKGVYERELPTADNEFAKTLGAKFETIEDVKGSIIEGLKHEKEQREKERIISKILREVAKESDAEIPDIMLEKSLESMVHETKAMMGNNPIPVSDEKLRESLKERAKERLMVNLIIHKISKDEKLEPTEEEIKTEMSIHNLDPNTHYDYSYGVVEQKKVFEFLESLEEKK